MVHGISLFYFFLIFLNIIIILRPEVHTFLEARSPKSQCQQGHALPRPLGRIFSQLLWQLPAILGIPCLTDISCRSHDFFLCVFTLPSLCLQERHSQWIRAHSSYLILLWLHLQRSCFQIRSHHELLRARTSTYIYIFRAHNSTQ